MSGLSESAVHVLVGKRTCLFSCVVGKMCFVEKAYHPEDNHRFLECALVVPK